MSDQELLEGLYELDEEFSTCGQVCVDRDGKNLPRQHTQSGHNRVMTFNLYNKQQLVKALIKKVKGT